MKNIYSLDERRSINFAIDDRDKGNNVNEWFGAGYDIWDQLDFAKKFIKIKLQL